MKKAFAITLIILSVGFYVFYFNNPQEIILETKEKYFDQDQEYVIKPSPFDENLDNINLPESKILKNDYHIYQTFNNCGPASLSMALSYFGINISQKKLGEELRPYQIPSGNNDDKSVTLKELAEKSKEYGFEPIYRPNGDINIIKHAIYYDIPVIIKTWMAPDDDVGHYRVVKGYDAANNEIIQDDSMQGKNLRFKYDYLDQIWKQFNYEYLLLVPKEKLDVVKEFLNENYNKTTAWENARENALEQLEKNKNDVYAKFNLSVANYYLGNYEASVEYYEQVKNDISPKMLWYQIEPILSYYELGEYTKIFEISEEILNNGNKAYSELYIVRGDIYQNQNKPNQAQEEYEKAIFYNKNIEIR